MHEAYYRDLCEGNITRPEGIRGEAKVIIINYCGNSLQRRI